MKTNPLAIFLAILITAIIAGGGVYLWQTQNQVEITPEETTTIVEEKIIEPEFKSLLYKKELYDLPFGAAVIEGYYTKTQRPTSLDGSTPDITCSAFVVTDGPSQLLDALNARSDMYGIPPTAVLGAEKSNWGTINNSTKENPIKMLVTLDPGFEGELIDCMPWPFKSFTEIEY